MASGMARRAAWVCGIPSLIGALLAPPAWAAPGDPLGAPFAVGAVYSRDRPAVARAPGGAFVVAYQNAGGFSSGVSAQRLHADGSPDGQPIEVAPPSAASVLELAVATDSAGDFVVAWTEFNAGAANVKARRFAANNSGGSAFLVDGASTSRRNTASPAVAMDPTGRFAVTWLRSVDSGVIQYNLPIPNCLNGVVLDLSNPSIVFRRYAADGTAQGLAPQVALDKPGAAVEAFVCLAQADVYVSSLGPYGGSTLGAPAIAMGAGGDFGITWAVTDGLGALVQFVPAILGPTHVSLQRYSAAGLPLGPQLVVHQTPGLFAGDVADLTPRIAQGTAGTALVWNLSTFQSSTSSLQDAVKLRTFGPAGLPLQLLAGTVTSGRQTWPWGDYTPDVAALPAGAVAAWRSTARVAPQFPQRIGAQMVDAAGAAVGAPIDVADAPDTTAQVLSPPAVVSDGGATFAVFWTALSQDGSQLMYGRLYSAR